MQAELATVKDELAVTHQEKQALQMQLVEKERALQATKADLIETRLELQRTETRLEVRPRTPPLQTHKSLMLPPGPFCRHSCTMLCLE